MLLASEKTKFPHDLPRLCVLSDQSEVSTTPRAGHPTTCYMDTWRERYPFYSGISGCRD